MGIPVKSLIHDVATRWNSTQQMIERISEQRWAVLAVFQDMKKHIVINAFDWDLVQELNVTLKPFLTATEFLSGQHYVSISGVAQVVCYLTAKMKK